MITRALIDFIQREQSTGITQEALTAKLREKGWKDADIESAFSFLSDFSDHEVPAPKEGYVTDFSEILFLMWRVYRSRWKQFLAMGFVYLWVSFLLALALGMLALPALPTFLTLVDIGDKTSAFFLMAPYLFLAICTYVVVQLWYMGTLYAIALKKGESLFERCRQGISHLPSILGIKIVTTLLLMMVFVPLLLVSFLTQNILVFVVFSPFFFIGAVILGFLLSLAVPAYFQGVAWREAALKSIRIVQNNALALAIFYLFFGVLLFFVSLLFRHTGPIAILFALGLVAPMEVLFMLALYRRYMSPHNAPKPIVPKETKKKTPKLPTALPA